MEYQEILVREYTAYLESKDRFVERSFLVNRFYIVIVLGLLLLMFWLLEKQGGLISPLLLASAMAGMSVSLMWLLNQDSYSYLIKVKLSDVIEKFEQHLPLQPHVLEYEGIKKRNEEKRVMFGDVQKGVAFIAFLVFFAVFIYHIGCLIIPFFLKMF